MENGWIVKCRYKLLSRNPVWCRISRKTIKPIVNQSGTWTLITRDNSTRFNRESAVYLFWYFYAYFCCLYCVRIITIMMMKNKMIVSHTCATIVNDNSNKYIFGLTCKWLDNIKKIKINFSLLYKMSGLFSKLSEFTLWHFWDSSINRFYVIGTNISKNVNELTYRQLWKQPIHL